MYVESEVSNRPLLNQVPMSGSTNQNKIVPVAEKKKVQLIAAFPVPGIHHKSFEILCQ